MKRLRSAGKVVQASATLPVTAVTQPGGLEVKLRPGVGEETEHITVRFTWNGQQFEAKFADFDRNSELIPESTRFPGSREVEFSSLVAQRVARDA